LPASLFLIHARIVVANTATTAPDVLFRILDFRLGFRIETWGLVIQWSLGIWSLGIFFRHSLFVIDSTFGLRNLLFLFPTCLLAYLPIAYLPTCLFPIAYLPIAYPANNFPIWYTPAVTTQASAVRPASWNSAQAQELLSRLVTAMVAMHGALIRQNSIMQKP